MITVAIETFVTGFLVAGLLFFTTVWAYYDYRDRSYYDLQRRRHIHHCVKCGELYLSTDDDNPVPCPSCGLNNASLRF